MSQVREIVQLGAEVLRLTAAEVLDIHAPVIQNVLSDMLTTLADTHGVGIAAPQIAASWRMLVVASRPSARYPHAPEMQPTIMINPRFEPVSTAKESDWEGCLSIPGIRALVPRYKQIKISYLDRAGNAVEQHLSGFIARVFQHEYDHLDGLLYLDRVLDNRDIISETEFAKLMAK